MTEFMTTHVEGDLVSGKCYLCMLEWSHLEERALDKVGQLRNLEVNQLVQVNNQDPVQLGAFDPGNEVLQILASTPELEGGESRKKESCYRRAYSFRTRESRLELKVKGIEPGQCNQTCSHRLR